MRYILLRPARNPLLDELCRKADTLVNGNSDVMNTLDLFLALSIYKIQLAGRYPFIVTDRVQINLFKDNEYRGLRIYEVEKLDTAVILEPGRLQ